MKRLLCIGLTMCLMVAGAAWAQSYVTLPTVGIRGGADYASYWDSHSTGISMKNQTNGAAAITGEWAVWHPEDYWSTLSVKTDAMWIRTGGRFAMSNGAIEKDKVDELRFAPSLLFRWTTHAPAPFIMAGPFVGYDITNSYTLTNAPANMATSGTISNWNKFNFGVGGGAGIQIPMPGGALNVDGRYNYGITNKFTGTVGNGLKRHTTGVLVMAGYDFKLPSSR